MSTFPAIQTPMKITLATTGAVVLLSLLARSARCSEIKDDSLDHSSSSTRSASSTTSSQQSSSELEMDDASKTLLVEFFEMMPYASDFSDFQDWRDMYRESGVTIDFCKRYAEGKAPIHIAAKAGSAPALSVLVNWFKTPVNLTDMKGCTALHYAVDGDKEDAFAKLVELGADIKAQTPSGATVLDTAYSKSPETVNWVKAALKKAGVEMVMKHGKFEIKK